MSGVVTVESNGSIWTMDDINRRYRRDPKPGVGRGPSEGPLVDGVWHPMMYWKITGDGPRRRLYIYRAMGAPPVIAPLWGVTAVESMQGVEG